MDFYFTDRKFNLIEIASTDGQAPYQLSTAPDFQSVKAAARTLSGTLIFTKEQANRINQMAALGNYVLYHDKFGKDRFMTIMDIRHDPLNGTHDFTAEDAGVDLINETVGAYTADKAYNIAYYINKFTYDSGFEIGTNEISTLSRKLKWDSTDETSLARILSVATQFDAELDFSFEISGTNVVKRYINIYKHRGADNQVRLYLDKDINNIVTTGDIYDLYTSVYATGGTPEGSDKPITLKGYKWTDPDGRYELGADGILRDTVAVQLWSRILSNDNPNPTKHHLQRSKSYEASTQASLLQSALGGLKKAVNPAVNYEVDIAVLPDNVTVGDTVHIVDDNEDLYLSARVLELKYDYALEQYTATLGDYLIEHDQVSSDLRELADQVKNMPKVVQYYPWVRYADDADGNGFSMFPQDKAYMAVIYGKTSTPSDNPSDYSGKWQRVVGPNGQDGADGIVGPAGEDGKTSYFHRAYANSLDGKTDFSVTDGNGKSYMGTYSDFIKADSTDPTKYNWALFKGPQGVKGDPGANGSKGPAGADGKSSYLHTAYAQSADGKTGFSTTDATDATYIGVYSDQTETDSTDPAKYSWMKAQGPAGADGAQGTPGKAGADGKTPYVHYAWATNSTGTTGFSTTDANGKTYVGVCTDYNQADPTTPSSYTWSLFVGPKGDKGDTGVGVAGPKGEDGRTPYTHTAWSWSPDGSDRFMTEYPNENLWINKKAVNYFMPAATGLPTKSATPTPDAAMLDPVTIPSTATKLVLTIYNPNKLINIINSAKPSFFKGETYLGSQSAFNLTGEIIQNKTWLIPSGATKTYLGTLLGAANSESFDMTIKTKYEFDQETPYTPAPSDDYQAAYPTYRGEYTDFTQADSTNYKDYKWVRVLGEAGGEGPAGKDSHTHIAYANSADGKTDFSLADSNRDYMGMYWDYEDAASTDPTKYKWTKTKGRDGTQGIPGPVGPNGKSSQFHQAWSDSSDGKTGFSTTISLGKKYLGTYTDYVEADSTDPAKYKWTELVGAIEYSNRNLVKNSGNMTNLKHWSTSGDATLSLRQHAFWKNSTENLFLLTTKGATEVTLASDRFDVEPGKEYVVQFDAFHNSNLRDMDVFFLGRKYGSTNEYDKVQLLKAAFTLSYSNSTHVELVFTTDTAVNEGYFRIDNNGAKAVGSNSDLYVTDISVTKGNKAAPWSPAPEDAFDHADEVGDNANQHTDDAINNLIPSPSSGISYPSNPKKGQQHWLTDANSKPKGLFQYDGSKWVAVPVNADTISANTLNGMTINGVTINGSTINSPNINVPFNNVPANPDEPANSPYAQLVSGTTQLTSNLKISANLTDGTNKTAQWLRTLVSPQGFSNIISTPDASKALSQIDISFGSMFLSEWHDDVTANDGFVSSYFGAGDAATYERKDTIKDTANFKGAVIRYSRKGTQVNVGFSFTLLSDTGWIGLSAIPKGYTPASLASVGITCPSLSYRGYFCIVYPNGNGWRLIPTAGQGSGGFQGTVSYVTYDDYPYNDATN